MNTKEYLKSLDPSGLKELALTHLDYCKTNDRATGTPVVDFSNPTNIHLLGFRENMEQAVNNGAWNDYLVVYTSEGSEVITCTVDPGVNKHMLGHLRQGFYDAYLVRPHQWAKRTFPEVGYIPRYAVCQDRGFVDVLRTDGDNNIIIPSERRSDTHINIHDRIGRDPSLACTVVEKDLDYVHQYLKFLYDIKNQKYFANNRNKLSYGLINHDRLEVYRGMELGKILNENGITYHKEGWAHQAKKSGLRTSFQGIDMIKNFEGLRLESYLDQAGIWTIGYGTIILDGKPVKKGMKITKDKAEEAFYNDVDKFEDGIEQMIKVPVNPNQFDALVSLTYNIGREGLRQSTALRELNEGDFEEAANAMLLWNKVNIDGIKHVSDGLKARRQKERDYFLKAA